MMGAMNTPRSRKRVRHGGLLLGDELDQRLVDGRVEGRGLVAGQHLLPDRVGALDGVEGARGLPLLEGVVVGDGRALEGGLEVGLGVGAAEEVLARAAPRAPHSACFTPSRNRR